MIDKVLVVLDSTTNCARCKLCVSVHFDEVVKSFCAISQQVIDPEYLLAGKPIWCGLSKVPEHLKVCGDYYTEDVQLKWVERDSYSRGFCDGYNECINDIVSGCEVNII